CIVQQTGAPIQTTPKPSQRFGVTVTWKSSRKLQIQKLIRIFIENL
ncbi:hypothetical protein MTR67_011437, partial [Solanum verrucosum]